MSEPSPSVPDLMAIARRTHYPIEAFNFVQRGLEYTVEQVHGDADPEADPMSRHVSGQALCQGMRDFAIQEYGLLAKTVLGHWHITNCEDFGCIVFALVDAKLLAKTDDDSIEDFRDVFDFDAAFSESLTLT